MTNIGHYRAAAKVLEGAPELPVRLWICPPTRMDERQLKAEGVYEVFKSVGARCEIPRLLALHGQTRRGSPTARPSSQPRRAISTAGWATVPAFTWAAPSWPW